MKTYGELREELDIGYLLELNDKLDQEEKERKSMSSEDRERKWEKDLEYFQNLSMGSDPVDIDDCIYKSMFEEGIQRRKKSQTEYMTRVSKLYQDLKHKQGDEKLDTIGDLLKIIIQFQLFGMR